MQLTCSALARFPVDSHVILGVSPTAATAIVHNEILKTFLFILLDQYSFQRHFVRSLCSLERALRA